MDKFKLNEIFLEKRKYIDDDEDEYETTDKFHNTSTRITVTTMKGVKFDYKPYLRILNRQTQYIYKTIIKQMYANYKQVWAKGKPVSPQDFIGSLHIDDITFRLDQKKGLDCIMWFNDGDLFAGHTIIVNGEFKNKKYVIDDIHI